MQIKLFTIPISDDGSAQAELNRFLQSHKVLKTESHFYAVPNGAAWCFCVNYLPVTSSFTPSSENKKIDYKTVLSETEFTKFSKKIAGWNCKSNVVSYITAKSIEDCNKLLADKLAKDPEDFTTPPKIIFTWGKIKKSE